MQGGDPGTASFALSVLKGGRDLLKLSDPKMEAFPPGQDQYQGYSATVFQQQENVAWDAGPGPGGPGQVPLVSTVGSGFQGRGEHPFASQPLKEGPNHRVASN